MRQFRNFKTNQCCHQISRIAHRAFFLDDEEKTRFDERLAGRAKKGLSVDDGRQQKVRRREFAGSMSLCLGECRVFLRRAATRWRMIC